MKGDVVVLPFPFSDLSGSKRRPALLIAELSGDDVILCMISGKNRYDAYSIPISEADFSQGSLRMESNIRPNRIFTADSNIIKYSAGKLHSNKTNEVINKIKEILDQ